MLRDIFLGENALAGAGYAEDNAVPVLLCGTVYEYGILRYLVHSGEHTVLILSVAGRKGYEHGRGFAEHGTVLLNLANAYR